MKDPRQHLIVALDVPEENAALELVETLKDHVGYFKVGLQLYTACGPSIVRRIMQKGGRVFLDLKLHDIPNTVASAVTEAALLGVDLLTLHTLGGRKMMLAAREAADRSESGIQLLGVTVLTSLDQKQTDELGFQTGIEDLVVRLAHLADSCGIDGIVCSPVELDRLSTEKFEGLFFVTPGIRPSGSSLDDQSRVKTPGEAISQGARHLVVGRPIVKAPSPAQAARDLLLEIQAAKI